MRPIEKASEDLFQKLRSRFSPITLGDESAESTADPKTARIFNFMYKEGDNDIGYVSISLTDSRVLKVYYGSDLLENLHDKNGWFAFLRDIRGFAKRNLLSFDARDLAKNQLEPRDFKFISQQDGSYKDHEVEVTESAMFGSRRKSYQTVESVKMIVNHRKSIDETIPGSRSRYIESIFIENADGERFKFPYNYLTGARAMTRHVAEGGTPYDNVGKHILETIKEMRNLSKFARRTKKYAMENAEAETVRSQVIERFQGLKKTLSAMSVKEGYARFVENFTAEEALVEDDAVNQLKERFTQQVFDTQLEDTLPSVMRAIKEAEMRKVYEADGSVEKLIKNPNWTLVLRKDDAADNLFKSTKFTDGQGLLGFILSDIAGRAIGDGVDAIANFASDAAERVQDRDYDAKDKQLAMLLAKKYMDDVKKMASDPGYADQVRMDPKAVYGLKKKREGGFHEAEALESWANDLVPEGQIDELKQSTYKSYGDKAFAQAEELGDKKNLTPKQKNTLRKRERGLDMVVKNLESAGETVNELHGKGDLEKIKNYHTNRKSAANKNARDMLDNTGPESTTTTFSGEMGKYDVAKANINRADRLINRRDKDKANESSFYRDGERTGSAEGAKRAILWRIQNQHLDLIKQYGLDKVLQAVDDEAEYLDNLEEIGSSDISAWVNNIKRNLAADAAYAAKNAAKKVGEDYNPNAAVWSKKFADNSRFAKSQSKADHLYARINPEYKKEKEKEAKRYNKMSKDYANKAVTGMDESPSYYSKEQGGTWPGTSYNSKEHGGTWEGPSYYSKEQGGTWPGTSYNSKEHGGTWEGPSYYSKKNGGTWDKKNNDERNMDEDWDPVKRYWAKKAKETAREIRRGDDESQFFSASGYSAKKEKEDRNNQAKEFDKLNQKLKIDAVTGMDDEEFVESQVNENWDDKDFYRFEDFKKKVEAKGYEIKGVMHWGYSDWRSSGDEPPHAELTVVDPKTGREGSLYWPKGAEKYFKPTNEATLGGEKYMGKENPNNKTKFLKKVMGQNKKEKAAQGIDNHTTMRTRANFTVNNPDIRLWDIKNPEHNAKRHHQAVQAARKLEGKTNEATTQGTQGTVGTQGTQAGNQGQFIRDPKLQQGAKNVSRVAQAAGINAPPQQVAQGMAAQAAGKNPPRQSMQMVGGLGNTIMQAAASDPQKAAQLTAMMKKMVTQGKFDEDAVKAILNPKK